jgi:hypothetical protein
MKPFLYTLSILGLLALASAPAFAIGPCSLQCTATSQCSQRCVGPDGLPMTCGFYGECMGASLAPGVAALVADPVQAVGYPRPSSGSWAISSTATASARTRPSSSPGATSMP